MTCSSSSCTIPASSGFLRQLQQSKSSVSPWFSSAYLACFVSPVFPLRLLHPFLPALGGLQALAAVFTTSAFPGFHRFSPRISNQIFSRGENPSELVGHVPVDFSRYGRHMEGYKRFWRARTILGYESAVPITASLATAALLLCSALSCLRTLTVTWAPSSDLGEC